MEPIPAKAGPETTEDTSNISTDSQPYTATQHEGTAESHAQAEEVRRGSYLASTNAVSTAGNHYSVGTGIRERETEASSGS